MEKKPASLRMLESLFECEQPHVDFAYTDFAHANVVEWQRNKAKHNKVGHGEAKRHAQLEPKSVSMSPVSTQEVAQGEA